MKNLPFSVFKRADRRYYSVKFKSEKSGKYLPPISTRQETEVAAIRIAFDWLKNGIPQKDEALSLQKCSIRKLIKEIDISKADAEYVCKYLQQISIIKSFVLAESKKAVVFRDYLLDFWDWDNSPYIKEKLRKKHGIHRRYVAEMKGSVARYWAPFFKDKLLGEVGIQDIEDFINYLEAVAEKAEQEQAERTEEWKNAVEEAAKDTSDSKKKIKKPKAIRYPKSPKRKNKILRAGTIALRRAFNKELIDKDITAGITWFSGESAERQILTPELAAAVFKANWNDERAKLANMLAMVTGMRAGEIQGLRVQDLGEDCVYVRHSWNFRDGLKPTKNNESRVVEVPFPSLIQALLNLAKNNPHSQTMDSHIFWAELSPDKPIESEIFLRDLRAILVKNGMSKESAKVYTFHGWRHYFSSYMQDSITEKLLQTQTGHKSLAVLRRYAGHKLSGDRQKIQQAQKEIFSKLLPEMSGDIQVIGGN